MTPFLFFFCWTAKFCHHHSTPLLEKLHWLRIWERIKYKVACMCFSAISGSGLAYFSELLHVYTPSRTLRSPDTRMLEIQQYKRKTRGFRTFSCFGPHICNSLPQDLRHCSTLSSFKGQVQGLGWFLTRFPLTFAENNEVGEIVIWGL